MPRAGLTKARVVEEAGRMADEEGLPRLTLAALAGRLGVRQPSLYKHVDGVSALQRSIAVQAKNELGGVLGRAAIGRSRGDAIRSLARAYLAGAPAPAGRFPLWLPAPAAKDADDQDASRAIVQVILAVLAGFDLQDAFAID